MFRSALALLAASNAVRVEGGCDVWTSSIPTVLLNVTDPSPVLFYPLKDAVYTSNNTGNPAESLQLRFGGCINTVECPPGFSYYAEGLQLYCETSDITAEQFTKTMQNYSAGIVPPCIGDVFSLNAVAEVNNNNSCASYIQMPDGETAESSLFTIWQQFSKTTPGAKVETPEPA